MCSKFILIADKYSSNMYIKTLCKQALNGFPESSLRYLAHYSIVIMQTER